MAKACPPLGFVSSKPICPTYLELPLVITAVFYFFVLFLNVFVISGKGLSILGCSLWTSHTCGLILLSFTDIFIFPVICIEESLEIYVS